MKTDNVITCSVTSDLMVLYTKGKTSEETNHVIHDHLGECTFCSRAFGLEPGIRGKVELAPKSEYEPAPDDLFDRARHYSLPVWGFVLFLATHTLALLECLFARFGLSTTTAKIRLYRARRKLAGRIGRSSAPESAA